MTTHFKARKVKFTGRTVELRYYLTSPIVSAIPAAYEAAKAEAALLGADVSDLIRSNAHGVYFMALRPCNLDAYNAILPTLKAAGFTVSR